MKRLISFLIILVSLVACDPPFGAETSYNITIKNNSNTDLIVCLSDQYPDTSVIASFNGWYGLQKHSGTSFNSKQTWEKYISNTPKDTISIFFISLDTFQKYGKENVIKDYMILRRRDFGIKLLQDNDYTIVYP